MMVTSKAALAVAAATARGALFPGGPFVTVGLGTCGVGNGAESVWDALHRAASGSGLVDVKRVGCIGFCSEEPLVMAFAPGRPALLFGRFDPSAAAELVEALEKAAAAVPDARPLDKLARKALARADGWDFLTSDPFVFGSGFATTPRWTDLPFFADQCRVVLRDCGMIDPESIDDYLAVGGYRTLLDRLDGGDPAAAIGEIRESGLRGRGGAGFPAWRKYEAVRAGAPGPKYVICNADEGDPGAYMNRNEIEGDPHMVLEGMLLAAWMSGASRGVVYIRSQYKLARSRLTRAVDDARARGLLGSGIGGSGFSFDIDIVAGLGSFSCGEETALMASVEGGPGRPRPRPPYPTVAGLFGRPTVINNVETLCNLPPILARGGAWFRALGDRSGGGTKVFSLVGKARNTGLIEVPLGTPLAAIVYGNGEGTGTLRSVRAVQTGGPSGGCVPADQLHIPVGYESLAELGSIMGSGGLVVLDDDDCMVDFARYFARFALRESCGKCVPCREGLAQVVRLLDGIVDGTGSLSDIDAIEALARYIRDASLCGLGRTAANPILTSIAHFRAEYVEHILARRCLAGVCENLFEAPCENSCPLGMNAPGTLQLLKEGRIEEAYELTLRDNPLPGTVGRVCHYQKRLRCRRSSMDDPICHGEIHRYLADTMYKMGREKAVYRTILKERHPDTGRTVAIVGAGPAGLTAAWYLSRLGHRVTVFDEHPEAGGSPRWRIPAFRLPSDITKKENEFIKSMGIRFVLNARIGRDIPFGTLETGFDATLVCVGARADRVLGIAGEAYRGVLAGTRFLEGLNTGSKRERPGDRVVVAGGGNAAVDAARSVVRLGASATVVYGRMRSEAPCDADELKAALEEGVEFAFLSHPVEILGDDSGAVRGVRVMRMKAGPAQHTGRHATLPTGEFVELPCDAFIVAAGEKVSVEGFELSDGRRLPMTTAGTVKVDPLSYRVEGHPVWAAGDAVSGPSSVAEAMGQAKTAARAMDRFLSGEDRFGSLFRAFDYSNDVPPIVHGRAGRPKRLDAHVRGGTFMEVSNGYTGEQASREASRCLRCDVRRGGEDDDDGR